MALTTETLNRLKTQLLASGIQQKNNALYQVINQLIDFLKALETAVAITSITDVGITQQAAFQQFISFGDENGDGGGDGLVVPGPVGPSGAPGTQGPMGPMGAIIFPPDAEDGQIFPPIMGPQGNPGITGPQGPVGAIWPLEDGRDGEDGFPIAPLGQTLEIFIKRTEITELEFEALNTSPKDLGIPAPGAGKIIWPIHVYFEVDLTVAYSSSPTYSIVFDGNTTNILSTTMAITATSGISKKSDSADGGAVGFLYSTFDPRNKLIRLRGSANPTGVGSATAVLCIIYCVLTTT